MATTILKVLMTLFCIQVLVKFYVFFFISYAARRKQLDQAYDGKTSATKLPTSFCSPFQRFW